MITIESFVSTNYNIEKGSLLFSGYHRELTTIKPILEQAFGRAEIEIKEVMPGEITDYTSKGTVVKNYQSCYFYGKADVYGHLRDVFLQFTLENRTFASFYLLVFLNKQDWSLSVAYPNLTYTDLPSEGRMKDAVAVLSYGKTTITHHQTMIDEDMQIRFDMIMDYPLRDGLQIMASGLVNGNDALDESIWNETLSTGIDEELLPPIKELPNMVEVWSDPGTDWVVMEQWWLGEGSRATGLATHIHTFEPGRQYHAWLQKTGAGEQTQTLEAKLVRKDNDSYYPLRYTNRAGHLGSPASAQEVLNSFLGSDALAFVEQYSFVIPDLVQLQGLTLAPNEFFQLSAKVEDTTGAYLIKLGPAQLRQVSLTLLKPLGHSSSPSKAMELTLEGVADIYGVEFTVKASPSQYFEGGLTDPEGIPVGKLLNNVLPFNLPFGLDTLTIDTCYIHHLLGTEPATHLTVGLTGRVALIPGGIYLRNISLDINQVTEATEVSFTSQFELGPVDLRVLVNRSGNSWNFDGQASAGEEGISLTELVDHLADTFDCALPDEIPDVRLEYLALNYDADSRTIDIQGITEFIFPDELPVIGGITERVILQLTVVRSTQAGGKQSQILIDWITEKEGYQLHNQFHLSGEEQLFALDFSVPDPTEPVHLSDLTNAVGLPALPLGASDVLDAVFQVSTFALNYQRKASELTVAWSRPLGEGTLLTEFEHQAGPEGPDGDMLHVSWLPHTAEDTIGIRNLFDLIGADDIMGDFADVMGSVGARELYDDALNIFTFRQLGFDWEHEQRSDTISISAISTYPNETRTTSNGDILLTGTKAHLIVHRGARKGFIAELSLVEEPIHTGDGSVAHLPTEPLPFTLPDFLPDPVKDIIEMAEEVLDSIELTHIMLSSITSQNYQPRAFRNSSVEPVYTDAVAPETYPFGSQSRRIQQGLAIGVRVRLGELPLLKDLIDTDYLEGQITAGNEVGLQLSIPTSLKLEASPDSFLLLRNPVLRIEAGTHGPGMELYGSLQLLLFGFELDMAGWLELKVSSIMGHLQLNALPGDFEIRCPALPGVFFGITEEDPIYAEIGYQMEPPGLDIGLQSPFFIYGAGKDEKHTGTVSFVFQEIEGVPNLLYAEFGMDELSLPIMLEARTGAFGYLHLAEQGLEIAEEHGPGVIGDTAGTVTDGVEVLHAATDHIESVLSEVMLRDVYFRWADGIVPLPDGTQAFPGVSFRGKLDFFGWEAFAIFDFSMEGIPGVSGHLEAEPINLFDVLKITGEGQGIRHKPTRAEDFYADPTENNSSSSDWYLEPGGPVYHFSSRKSPFFFADLKISLFNFLYGSAHAEITDHGFEFDFEAHAGNLVGCHLNCHYWKEEAKFEATGDLFVELKRSIGPVLGISFDLDTGLDGHVEIAVDGEKFHMAIDGSFHFEGVYLHLPSLSVDVAFRSVEELADAVLNRIEEAAEDIFIDFLGPLAGALADGAEAVADFAVDAGEEIAEIGTAAAEEATALAKGTYALAADGVEAAGEAADAIAGKAADIADGAADLAEDAAKPLLNAADDVLEEIGDIEEEVEEFVGDVAAAAERTLGEAIEFFDSALDSATEFAGQQLAAAADLAEAAFDEAWGKIQDFGRTTQELYNGLVNAIGGLLDGIGDLKDEIKNLAKRIYKSGKRIVKKIISPSSWF